MANPVDTRVIAGKLEELLRTLPHDFAVVYLFGSVARREAGPQSDLDLAVVRARPAETPLARLNGVLAGELERVLRVPVEIVDLETAPVDLAHRVLRDGRVVFENDRSKRIAVETRLRARYFDLRPIFAEYRKERRTA